MKSHLTARLLVAALVIGASSGVVSQSREMYTITDLRTAGGAAWMSVYDINASGQVVGYAWLGGHYTNWHAVLWQDGVMKNLGTLGGTSSAASGINALGQVVGYARTSDGVHAFLYQDGVMNDLGTLGGRSSSARGINDSGQVVGYADTSGDAQRAFLYQDGVMSDLGTLGGTSSAAFGINALGQVVGSAQTTDGAHHAFLYQDGVMNDLGTLGGGFSRALAINASGQVVGFAYTTAGAAHAFLWQDGVMRDLGTLGGIDTVAIDINASGQVVGGAYIHDGETRVGAWLWQNGVMTDLNTLLPPGSGRVLGDATAINDAGHIVGELAGWGHLGVYLLSPPGIAGEPGPDPPPPTAFTVEAETFAGGGQSCWEGPFQCGGGYYDETPGNWGDAQVRPGTDVDLWYDDGGIVIGGLDGLEWVTFPVNVLQSGQYTVTFRTASPADRPDGSGVINVGIHGVDGSWVGNQPVPVTGGPGEWHSYVSWNAPRTIYLPAGPQTLTMWAAGGWYNVRKMTFTLETNSRE